MLRQLDILQKGLALIIPPLLLQAIFGGVLLWRLALRNDVENWAIHTKEVIAQAETVFRVLVESDSEVNTFALTGEERVGKLFERTLSSLTAETGRLRTLVNDNPGQVARAEAVAQNAEYAAGQMRAIYQAARGKDTAGVSTALDNISGTNVFANVRRQINQFIGEEEKLDKQRLSLLHATQVQQYWILAGGMGLLLAVSAVCAAIFGRTIVRRLAVLSENVRRLTSGRELASRLQGTDELAGLDGSFHRMAEELAASAAKEKAAQEDLARRAAELTAINRELTQKSEENEMFVYSVSHDLRSPLVNLQGFSKELSISMREMREVFNHGEIPARLKSEGEDIINHGMAEPVSFIQTAVTRLSAIIDALLRLSRAGRVEYQRKEVNVEGTVRRIIDASRVTMAEKNAGITVRESLPQAWGDPTAIEQIFANLVGNALNYLDKTRPGIIEIGSRPDDVSPNLTVYHVKDNGLGIPEAYQSKIFAIFQRVHGNVAIGEGIGLALVKRMVERHGGRIWVESTEKVGSTFYVSLPTVEKKDEETAPTDPQEALAGV